MWNLGYPKVYVLTLQSDSKRVDHVTKILLPSLAAQGFQNVEVFNAIDGEHSRDAMKRNQLCLDDAFSKVAQNGQIGCYCSHFEIWQCILERGESEAIILEDDAYPSQQMELSQVLKEGREEEADLIWLYSPASRVETKPFQISNRKKVLKAYPQSCTVAYYVTLKGAQILMDNSKLIEKPVDMKIQDLVFSGKILALACLSCPFLTCGQKTKKFIGQGLRSNVWDSGLFCDPSNNNDC